MPRRSRPPADRAQRADDACRTEPPTSTAPEPTAPPTSSAPAGRAFTILVAGDLLAHTSVIDQARAYAADGGYDFSPMLRKVQPIVAAADVAICHLETPVAPPGAPPDGSYPDYGVPAEITAAIASAGFDRCSLASNHAMDKGAAGVDATLDAFDAAGLGHAGMARTPAEAGPTLFTVGGTTVAHLSYTFSFNGRRLPKDQPWRSNLIDPARIVAEARQARQDGARFVGRVAALGHRGVQRGGVEPAAVGGGDHGQRCRRRHRRPPCPRRPADRTGQRPLGGLRARQLPDRDGPVQPLLRRRAARTG